MKAVSAFAPCRIDLAGGTLDIPPLQSLVSSAATVNLAIDIGVEVSVEPSRDEASHIEILDRNISYQILADEPNMLPPGAELINAIHGYFFGRHRQPMIIRSRSHSPPGAGLGASSALCAALVSACGTAFGEEYSRLELLHLCHDLEERVLGTPAGYQDFVSAIYGGLLHITYPPGGLEVERLEYDKEAFEQQILLVYTGDPHHSGLNNWEVIKRYVEGNKQVRSALADIGTVSTTLAKDLRAGNLMPMAIHVGNEWRHRKTLSTVVSTSKIDSLIREAVAMGGAGKVCGAGGGGCIFLWHDGSMEQARQLSLSAEKLGCNPLPFKSVQAGVAVQVRRS